MDVDTTLSVLRPRNAYEDYELDILSKVSEIKDADVADILFSGKIYVDVWDTSNAETYIENNSGHRALDAKNVNFYYGDTTITSELRDIIVVGYGKRLINNNTYYDNVQVYGVRINSDGEPIIWDHYTDKFKGMSDKEYDVAALTDYSYVQATTYLQLKGLEYKYNTEIPCPVKRLEDNTTTLKHDYTELLERIWKNIGHSIKDYYYQPLADLWKFINKNLNKSPGISAMPCYKSMHHNGYSTRSNTVVPLQNTLYFMGRSRSDTQEYKFFMDDLRGELCRLAAYNYEVDAEAVDGWLNKLLE